MASVFGSTLAGERLERAKASPRYADGGFRNTARISPGLKPGTTVSTMTEFFLGGDKRRTPPRPLPSENPLAGWSRPVETGLRVTWLGHSTVLLEIDGMRLLTDPVWGDRASPLRFAGPKRFQPVPVPISALPPLDAVLISHDHYDHLDYPSVLELAKVTNAPFITSLGVGAHLESWGVPAERILELDWWEHASVRDVTVHAAPAQHFSGRGMGDRNRALWSSFVIQSANHRLFFSGDTGLTEEYREIRDRFGRFDLVMLEVGAWHPAWGDIHLGPANALDAHALLGSGVLLPVHWGTFNLALHAWDEPAETLYRLGSERGTSLAMPTLGTVFEPSKMEAVEPWWRGVGA